MSSMSEKLYDLLPAIYRLRDAEFAARMEGLDDQERGELHDLLRLQKDPGLSRKQQGRLQELLEKKKRGPLGALLSVIGGQLQVMEADIAGLYENWFIETCDEWVIPYIGDLLGVRGLHPDTSETFFSQRARVANTLAYRRRKGTATVLEQLASDTTGWPARAVEFFELLGTTQNHNHIRIHNSRTPDIRRTDDLELLNTAFDRITHTADVRHIDIDRGRHNIPCIGLFLWRLQSYPVCGVTALPVEGKRDGCYTFSPLGFDTHFFNRPQVEKEITHLADEINVPGPLRRRPLYDELEARRQALIDGRTPDVAYFGERPVFQIHVQYDGLQAPTEIPPENILICDLSEDEPSMSEDWPRPRSDREYQPGDGSPGKLHPISVAVDPETGRLAFPEGTTPNKVEVSYSYGFSGDLGGGPYNRRGSVDAVLEGKVDWQVAVSGEMPPAPGAIFGTIAEAIETWNSESASPDVNVGIIALTESCTYDGDTLPRIRIREGKQLAVVAADWPEEGRCGPPSEGKSELPRGQLYPSGLKPHLRGNVKVEGKAAESSATPGRLLLDGLSFEGNITILKGNLGGLRIAHCTLVPGRSGLKVGSGNERLKIDLDRSILGSIDLKPSISGLSISESIVDNAGGQAITALGTPIEMRKTTVFGETRGLGITASDCIFNEKIEIVRRQEGCVRFSYIPQKSKTPRRFRCQPDMEIDRQVSEAEERRDSGQDRKEIEKRILGWLIPTFSSSQYGHHAYAQLSRHCPRLITTGAEDGSEMGAFSFLKQPQRAASLRDCIDEYLRFGLEAGLIFVT